ncbi:MAG: hypothetical protein MR637_00155 [Clostridiales bacterium]|nr:hypothetical protein [Clostridiales bacterium]
MRNTTGEQRRRKQAAAGLKKDWPLLLTVIPAAVTALISVSHASAYVPVAGLNIGKSFYATLAYGALMNTAVWQILLRPELGMKERILLNTLPAELLLWLHLCRTAYRTAMCFFYAALALATMAYLFGICRKGRTAASACSAGLIMALVLFVPSIEAVGSQYQQLNRACMLIAEHTGPAKWGSQEAERPILSEAEWEGFEAQDRLDFLREVMEAALADMGVKQSVNLVACEIESDQGTVLGEYCFVEGEVRINMNHLRESGLLLCVETVLHEARHCFQHDAVLKMDWENEMVLTGDYFRAAREWREEFRSSEEERDYFTLSSEEDARDYSYNNVWLYVR